MLIIYSPRLFDLVSHAMDKPIIVLTAWEVVGGVPVLERRNSRYKRGTYFTGSLTKAARNGKPLWLYIFGRKASVYEGTAAKNCILFRGVVPEI